MPHYLLTPVNIPENVAFKALGSPIRRRILETLAVRGRARPTQAFFKQFGMSRSAVSQHLRALKKAGLVFSETRGKNRIYHADPDALDAIARWVDHLKIVAHKNMHDMNVRFISNEKRNKNRTA